MGHGNGAQPAWWTEEAQAYLDDRVISRVHRVVAARVPKWTAGSAIAAIVGALAIVAAIGAGAVAMERTNVVPGLLHSTTVLETKVDGIERALDRLERHFGTKPVSPHRDDP